MKRIHLQSERKLLKILLEYDFDQIAMKSLKFPEFLRVDSEEITVTHVEEPLFVVSRLRPGFMWDGTNDSSHPIICIPGRERRSDQRRIYTGYIEPRFNNVVASLIKLVEKCSKYEERNR